MRPPLEPLALPDLWAFCARQNRPLGQLNYLAILDDARCGRLFGLRGPDGDFVAIGAITPLLPGLLCAWISVSPGGLGRPLPVHAIRALFGAVAAIGKVVAVVDEADERAKRLVRVIGLEWVEAGNNGTGIWEWRTR